MLVNSFHYDNPRRRGVEQVTGQELLSLTTEKEMGFNEVT